MIVDVTEKIGDTLSNRRSRLEVESKLQPPQSVRIAFAGKLEDCKRFFDEYPAAIANLSIPPRFWATSTKDLNGCSDAKYNYDDDDGALTSLDTWSCFKLKEADSSGVYIWHQMTMFIRWNPIEQNTFIFCSDLSKALKDRLSSRMPSVDPRDPYVWHAVFIDELREAYDVSVWKIRDLVRAAEKARDDTRGADPDFRKLHNIARHAIHSNETLDVAIDTIGSIVHEHELFILREGSTSAHSIPKQIANDVARQLYYHSKELRAIKARSSSLYDRLQNEINLGFNIVSQTDTAAMKIISAVGLIFLPGTFISTLFGMNFFEFSVDNNTGKQTFAMSDKFWIYWAISLPVTAVVILLWAIWDYSYALTKMLRTLWEAAKQKSDSLYIGRKGKNVRLSSLP
ncbi:hypothetical protein AJ78_01237 [Emergomyces pasteurianus Ep9510]|uniref:Magnesium and cobalt transporter CorA n=1 Tax=Emergomyces pasteurianus Ep9510 TaxID=1447872 RepID=A0A1J9PRC2_9EURO|nr:hypothetical protein AJ78_01237 [Emergomyces pasteurianus Ep9510]